MTYSRIPRRFIHRLVAKMKEQQNTEESKQDKNRTSTEKKNFVPAIAVIISIGALIVSFWQQQNTRRSAAAAERSADNASKSVEVAKRNVELAEIAARISNRAYISVLPPKIEGSIGANPLRIVYFLKNDGRTSAYDVQGRVIVRILRNEEVKNIEDPHNWEPHQTKRVITPGMQTTHYLAVTEKPKSHSGLPAENYRIIVWGKITYKDTYGKHHWSTFCYFYVWGHEGFDVFGDFNDADKDYENNK